MNDTERTIAIIVAAGGGTRAGGDGPKQFRRVGGRALVGGGDLHLGGPA